MEHQKVQLQILQMSASGITNVDIQDPLVKQLKVVHRSPWCLCCQKNNMSEEKYSVKVMFLDFREFKSFSF
jgi:hypothetical protein